MQLDAALTHEHYKIHNTTSFSQASFQPGAHVIFFKRNTDEELQLAHTDSALVYKSLLVSFHMQWVLVSSLHTFSLHEARVSFCWFFNFVCFHKP